jgi:hypothetical protein
MQPVSDPIQSIYQAKYKYETYHFVVSYLRDTIGKEVVAAHPLED